MRKITSKHDEEKKQKRNQFIIGGLLVFVMLFSTAGFAFQGGDEEENSNKLVYNNFEFFNQNGFWFVRISGMDFVFKYNPKEVQRQSTQFELTFENASQLRSINNYHNLPLYISSESREAEREIYSNLNQVIQRMQYACIDEEECEGNFPVKSCENNFIVIKESNETGIVQFENCVFISGAKENLTKLTDEFLFKALGIEQQSIVL